MKLKKCFFVYLILMAICCIPALALSVFETSRQLKSMPVWFSWMELLTPIMMLGMALVIHTIHKARAA